MPLISDILALASALEGTDQPLRPPISTPEHFDQRVLLFYISYCHSCFHEALDLPDRLISLVDDDDDS